MNWEQLKGNHMNLGLERERENYKSLGPLVGSHMYLEMVLGQMGPGIHMSFELFVVLHNCPVMVREIHKMQGLQRESHRNLEQVLEIHIRQVQLKESHRNLEQVLVTHKK